MLVLESSLANGLLITYWLFWVKHHPFSREPKKQNRNPHTYSSWNSCFIFFCTEFEKLSYWGPPGNLSTTEYPHNSTKLKVCQQSIRGLQCLHQSCVDQLFISLWNLVYFIPSRTIGSRALEHSDIFFSNYETLHIRVQEFMMLSPFLEANLTSTLSGG